MTTDLLTGEERAAIRAGVGEAVRGTLPGLAAGLDRDAREFLRLVAATHAASEAGAELLNEAVIGARRAGLSWESIGGALGVTRQAAQQRFGASAPAGEVSPERRVLSGVHAFNEQAVLEVEGDSGYHLVGFGPLYMEVERSDHPWEHRRVTLASGAVHARLEREGWEHVGNWFPFSYYKRPA